VKASRISFWIAALSLAVVLLVGVVDMRRTSPGPVTEVHGRVADIDGGESCSACHGGWFSDMTASCEECHEPIAQQIEARSGLHGAQPKEIANRCATCHSEHHGSAFAIVNDQSFALAGAKSTADFDHELIGWTMDGAHAELECSKCHTNANEPVLPEGGVRYLGLSKDCGSCHEDPHEGRMVVSCASCHGQSEWEELHSVGHEKQLPLIGGHGDISCRECHGKDEPHSLEVLGEAARRPKARECVDCHETPHTADFTRAEAKASSMTIGAGCVSCHAAEHDSFRDNRLELSDAQHAASGFALALPHDEVGCAECHSPDAPTFAARYPGRGQDQCSACHDDPHGGQFAQGPFSQGDCIACHSREHFEPHEFDVEKHSRTALVLDGAHLEEDCSACHADPAQGEPRKFHGTQSDCDACHKDAHDDFFAPRLANNLPVPPNGDCARCHDAESFENADSRFDHARWTGFAVLGSHAQAACEACHPRSQHPDAADRTFGRVSEHFGKFENCETCHADPHDGDFDTQRHPKVWNDAASCARCHDETSFRSTPHGFDHGLWTRFALKGGHEEVACSQCHTPLRTPDKLGRTWARAAGRDCSDCHEDPHAGQFNVDGAQTCAACHITTDETMLDFDHEVDARFALGDAHRDLDCAECHRVESRDGFAFTRYTPIPRRCVDCHGVGEDVLLRRKPRGK